MKARNTFAVLLAACLPLVASAVSDVWRATPEEIKRTPAWMVSHAQRPVDTNEVVVADVPQDMRIFLLVGQSNMAGRGDVGAEDARPIARCLKLNRDGKWVEASTPIHFDRATAGYGIANSFVRRYLAEHPTDTVGLVPCAVGGSLSVTWSPEDAPDPVGTNFRRALVRAREAQKNGRIVGILWHQGESDIGLFAGDPGLKERYAARLAEMARAFRVGLNCPDVPFLVGEIGTLPKDCTAMNPILAEAARRIPNGALVKASDLTGHLSDGVHFDTPSYTTLGIRYYDAWKRLSNCNMDGTGTNDTHDEMVVVRPLQSGRGVLSDPLTDAREVLWTTLRDRFFCEKTEMLYDVLWQTDDRTVSATACLPTPEEAARQYPNPCSWGTGLQDCVFNGGPYLAVALVRGDREVAQSIFRGLRRCAEVSGVPGFVARGVLPSDGKGYYYNSSRDVWTLFVFYLWRYYHSDLCDAPTRETIRRLVVDVARYAESCVRPENGYNMLRADGKVGLATQMWVKNPKCRPWTDKAGWDFFEGLRVHEALRLPMFYAAAFDLSGDVHWREMELRYLDDGIAMAGGKIGSDIRASVLNQMQLSNRLLWETETDPDRKARLLRLLNRAADIARDHVTTRLAHDFAAGKWQVSKPIPDWHKAGFRSRNWGDGGVLNGYRYDIPDQPVFSIEDGYVEASHALLVQAMTPDREIDGRTLRLFREATDRMDLSDVACANAVNALLAMYQKGLDAALAAAVTASASDADPVVVQPASNGYNAWPMVQTIGSKVVCAYSRGTAHDIGEGVRGVFARTSSDGGQTWGDEVVVANDAAYGEVAIGKGLDADGAMLLWVRCWGGENPHHDLYRTTDGVTFTKIATPRLDPVPMQITDVFSVPGVGLMCLWFSDGYAAEAVRAWGKLVSTDNGYSWSQTTVETNLARNDIPKVEQDKFIIRQESIAQ